MAPLAPLLQSASSVIFRILAYLYLRIIPGRTGFIILPSVFAVYLGSFLVDALSPRPSSQPLVTKAEQDEKTNGHSTKDEVDASEADTTLVTVSLSDYLM